MAKQKVGKHKECILLGLKIRELRETKNLTQEVAAHRMKIHRTYLAGIESGVRNPSLTLICKMAKGLKVTASELLGNQ